MYQLSGLDNLMVAGELPDIPLHMSALFIYEPGGDQSAVVDHALACSVMQQAIDHQFPILRCKLDALPLAMDRGYWVEDKHFDITRHIACERLPAPAAVTWPVVRRSTIGYPSMATVLDRDAYAPRRRAVQPSNRTPAD